MSICHGFSYNKRDTGESIPSVRWLIQ